MVLDVEIMKLIKVYLSCTHSDFSPIQFAGAFLIPYFICVITAGVPMALLETQLGQFMAQGGILCWKICPIFQGQSVLLNVILCSPCEGQWGQLNPGLVRINSCLKTASHILSPDISPWN